MNNGRRMIGRLAARLAIAGAMAVALASRRRIAQPVEIQWWHAMGGALGERVDELVKNFNASQQKYVVVATNKGNYDEVINGTIAAYRAKRAPQIVQIYERGFMTMLLSDATVPVQDLLDRAGLQDRLGRLHQAGRELLQLQGQADDDAVQLVDADPLVQQGALPEGRLRQAGRDLAGAREAALRDQAEGHLRSAARCSPATTTGACSRTTAPSTTSRTRTQANGYDGLDTEFVYNKTSVVGQVARIKKWIDDGVMEIAGQGLSPEQLFTSGKCSTFFASTAAHGSVEAQRQDSLERHLPAVGAGQARRRTAPSAARRSGC